MNFMMTKPPDGWEFKPIKEYINGAISVFNKENYSKNNFRYIDISSIDNIRKQITGVTVFKTEEAPSRAKYILKEGDLIVSTVRPNLNAISLVDGEYDGCICSSGFSVLRLNKHAYAPYFFRYLASPTFVNAVTKMVQGAMYPAVNDDDIKNFLIPIPPKYEDQSTIANELESKMAEIEKMRQAALRQKEAAEALKVKILLKAFPFKNGDKLPEGWKWKKIINLVKKDKHSIKRGPFGSSIRKDCFVDSGFKVYEQKNAIYNNFEIGTYYINKDKFNELKDFELKPDDLIISCSGTIGKIAIAPQNIQRGVINQALLKISLDHEIIFPNYFVHFFESIVSAHMANESRGAAIKNLSSVNSIKSIAVPISATYGDQISISNKIENEINDTVRTYQAMEKQLEAIQALPGAILREVFDFQEANA